VLSRAFADIPDWRDGEPYHPLLEVERAGLAWEWLRRQPAYRQAAFAAIAGRREGDSDNGRARAWHLHGFEDPRLMAPAARPIWTANRHPWVLRGRAEPSTAEEGSFALEQFGDLVRLAAGRGIQHLLLSDGRRSIRLDIAGPRVERQVRLWFDITEAQAIERQLLMLRRLHALARDGRFSEALQPMVQRARRHILLLRSFDALRAGASHADIAELILPGNFDRHRWRLHSSSVRSQAQRLALTARRMADGGFWKLLD
jgi:hypothetical protein